MALVQSNSSMISKGTGILKYEKTFPQLLAAGSTGHINTPGAKFHVYQVTVTNINTNVICRIDGSNDGTSFFIAPVESATVAGIAFANNLATITANGTYLIYAKDVAMENTKFTFISEAGGATATIDVVYFGRS